MLRHVKVLVVAVAVALGLARGLTRLGDRATTVAAAAPAPAAPSLIPFAPAAAADGPAEAAAAADPSPPPAEGVPGEIDKAADGHFWAEAEVNGRAVRVLVDTGASYVALTRTDALRLGLQPDSLSYDAPVSTANGRTRAARVELAWVSVAGARVEEVPAMVLADGLSTSLLGMSYLGRLSRLEATPTSLVLRP